MAKSLTAISAALATIHPKLDTDNTTLIGLDVSLNVTYKDLVGGVSMMTTTDVIDGWAQLSSLQKANMQDIRDTIVAYALGVYS